MSYIGGYMDGYRGLVVWGVASGLFYLAFTSYLFKLTRFANKRIRRMLFAACSMLVITVLLPFVPETWPRAATLHNLFAMLAPVIMIITMYVFVFYLGKCDHRIYRKALTFLNAMVLISALLMFALGASGLLEVLFSVSMCVLLFSILIWLSRSEHLDLVLSLRQAEESRQAEEAAREAEAAARKALARAEAARRAAQKLEADALALEEKALEAVLEKEMVEQIHRKEEAEEHARVAALDARRTEEPMDTKKADK
jgi:hypothetical protein